MGDSIVMRILADPERAPIYKRGYALGYAHAERVLDAARKRDVALPTPFDLAGFSSADAYAIYTPLERERDASADAYGAPLLRGAFYIGYEAGYERALMEREA